MNRPNKVKDGVKNEMAKTVNDELMWRILFLVSF